MPFPSTFFLPKEFKIDIRAGVMETWLLVVVSLMITIGFQMFCWNCFPILPWFVFSFLKFNCDGRVLCKYLHSYVIFCFCKITTNSCNLKITTNSCNLKSCQPATLEWLYSTPVECWLRPESLFLAATGDRQRIPFYMNVEEWINAMLAVDKTQQKWKSEGKSQM